MLCGRWRIQGYLPSFKPNGGISSGSESTWRESLRSRKVFSNKDEYITQHANFYISRIIIKISPRNAEIISTLTSLRLRLISQSNSSCRVWRGGFQLRHYFISRDTLNWFRESWGGATGRHLRRVAAELFANSYCLIEITVFVNAGGLKILDLVCFLVKSL